MNRLLWLFSIVLAMVSLTACNEDNDIVQGRRPTIEFDSPDGVYTVRVGQDVRIDPVIGYGEGASFRWTSGEGEVISTNRTLVMNCPRLGSFYVMLTVTTAAGSASAEARIDVLEQAPPVIDLSLPTDGIYLLPGQEMTFEPRIQNADLGFIDVQWSVDGVQVGDELSYTFKSDATGVFRISVVAENEDGRDSLSFDVNVVSVLPRAIKFRGPSLMQSSTTRYTFAGRRVVLMPELVNVSPDAVFAWSVNGQPVDCTSGVFVFTPSEPGSYLIGVKSEGVMATVEVVCVAADEAQRRRPVSGASSPYINKVWEYVPAPGQFIGDDSSIGGMPSDVTSHSVACRWAEERMANRLFVSLGAWGGYVICGFDHSVDASSVAELAIYGNAFDQSNEPGVVWVMQDVNGNGIPDDEWYQLKGSAYADPLTWHNYAVTYYKPAGSQLDVEWIDAAGARGLVDFIPSAHTQASYYPAWIDAGSYTLYGTRLPANGVLNAVTGQWATPPLAWGYADNMGSDLLHAGIDSDGVPGQSVGLSISNAVMADGTPVKLQYVDFVMVQSGIQQQLGRLGESSTEVCSIADRSMVD